MPAEGITICGGGAEVGGGKIVGRVSAGVGIVDGIMIGIGVGLRGRL